MELILNNFPNTRNHYYVIRDMISWSKKINIAVAFIKVSGLETVLDLLEGKDVKILCSLSFGTTDHQSLTALLDKGYHVKFCKIERGILHSKIWIFKTNRDAKALVGSANLTKPALVTNSEASVLISKETNKESDLVNKLIGYFDYLWYHEAKDVDREVIANLSNLNNTQAKILKKTSTQSSVSVKDADRYESIMMFIKSWIDLGPDTRIPGETGKLWRGWYIIPDQGLVDDDMMELLRDIIVVIHNNGNSIDTRDSDSMEAIYKLTRTTYSENHSMTDRELFIRRQKNYLIKFGFAFHPLQDNGQPDMDILELTDSGIEIAVLKEPVYDKYRQIFTDNMLTYTYNNFLILPFVLNLIQQFNHIDFFEFSSFVNHVYSDDKLDLVTQLLSLYRKCSEKTKQRIKEDANSYFDEVLGPTANNVRGNYEKKIRHQMSVIGWISGYFYDPDDNRVFI